MKKIFILTFLSVSGTIFSQNNLRGEYDSSRVNLQKGNYQNAILWLEKAKISAKLNPKDTNTYVEILKLCAIAYAKSGKDSLAEKSFLEANQLYTLMPTKKVQLASLSQNFGVFYFNQRKYSQAETLFLKSIKLKSETSGENNPEYLQSIQSLASCFNLQKKYDDAIKTFTKSAQLRKQLNGENADYLNNIEQLGNLNKVLGNYTEAIKYLTETANLTKILKNENSKEYALSLINLANVHKSNLNYSVSEDLYLNASQIFQNIGGEKNPEYGFAQANLGTIYRLQSAYVKAEPFFIKSQSIIKDTKGENSKEYAEILNNMALFYNEIGKYEVAESYYKQAIDITKKMMGEKHPDAATTYSNLGLLYKSMGRYEQAEPILQRVMRIRKEVLGEKTPEFASSLNNLASVYENMNRLDQALNLYKQSESILKNTLGENSTEYALTLNNLAGVYEQTRKYNLAEPLIIKSLSVLKNNLGETHPDYNTTLNNLALLQEAMGKTSDAIGTFQKNIETTKLILGENHPNYATSLSNFALLLAGLNRYSEAEPQLLKVLDIRKQTLPINHPSYTYSLYNLAKLYTCMKKYEVAEYYWEQALSQYLYQINTFFPSMSEKEKGKFYALISPKFEQFYSFVVLRAKENPVLVSKMFTYQLATKALLLNSSNKIKQRILQSNDQNIISKFRNWNSQKELLARASSLSKEELLEEKINLESLSAEANELEKELSAQSEIFRNDKEKTGVTWIDIQKTLKSDDFAIEMIRFPKFKFDSMGTYLSDSVHYAALIINPNTKSNPELVVLKNGAELEKQVSKYYRNAIKFKTQDELSYNQYWSRMKKYVSSAKKIYFSPDGIYNQLNLNTLLNIESKKYLADEVDIQVLTNLKELLKPFSVENLNKKVNLVGSPDFTLTSRNISKIIPTIASEQAKSIERAGSAVLVPLPGTKIEVEKIGGLLATSGWNPEIFTESNALEENIKAINNPKVLHIATHGFFDQDMKKNNKKTESETENIENPLLKSGLYLTGASLTILKRKNDQLSIDAKETSKEDGILTAYEAMNLQLEKTDLVVLSACETGLGEVKNGEGVYGLQRALKIAGAKSIIISLWTVNDAATQELMTLFYQEWIKTNDKRLAFKNAQSGLRKKYPEPYFWGAFVMLGE